ncbi:hypothetical protein [Lentibacillus sp. Marseille-P4043]|uniref:hypothetical protein n=1 Tax=Lentibacillus sp. Marseille-P4043 TaxID=2040293 RepID=UPI000D0ACBFF|nr:hypothetical protein [Lentibacillus sp. Marseille-P4043]
MQSKLPEESFAALRGPFESGRQKPKSLAFTLLLFVFIQPLMFFLTYVVAADGTIYPNKDMIMNIHLWITAALVLLSIIFAIPVIYNKGQIAQYLLIILTSQNTGATFLYISSLFLLGSDRLGIDATKDSLLNFMYVTLIIGLLVFIVTWIRFYVLLQRGHYREGSKKDNLRKKFEAKSYLPMAIIVGTGVVYVIQYVARNSYMIDINVMVVVIIGPLLFFAMLFVLPEQIVILYCKYRFESFNFNKDGNLKPISRKDA